MHRADFDFETAVTAVRPYDETTWGHEVNEKRPLRCPVCKTAGFYGPREIAGGARKYRACKFCGFWQEADGTAPYRCWHSLHDCTDGPCLDWKEPDRQHYECGICGAEVGREHERRWPSDDAEHPWAKLVSETDEPGTPQEAMVFAYRLTGQMPNCGFV